MNHNSPMKTFYTRKLIKRISDNQDSWDYWAHVYYNILYTMYDKTPEEKRYINRLWNVLSKTIPEKRRNTVSEVPNCYGCMGEQVYLADNYLTHTLHLTHEKCMKSDLIRRERPGENNLWCCRCNSFVEKSEVLTPNDEKAIRLLRTYNKITNRDLDFLSDSFHNAKLGFYQSTESQWKQRTKDIITLFFDEFCKLATGIRIYRLSNGNFVVDERPAYSCVIKCKKCKDYLLLVHKEALKDSELFCSSCNEFKTDHVQIEMVPLDK